MHLKHILGTILNVCALCAAGPIPVQQTQVNTLYGGISKSDAIDEIEKDLYARQLEMRIFQQNTGMELQHQPLSAAPALPKTEHLPLVIPGGIATPILARMEPSRERTESVIVVPNTGTEDSDSNTVLPRDIDWSEIIERTLFWMFNSECLDSAKRSTVQRVSNVKALNEQANLSVDVAPVSIDQGRAGASSDAEHALSGHTTKTKPKRGQASGSEGFLENWTRTLGSPKLLQRSHNKDNNPNHIIVYRYLFHKVLEARGKGGKGEIAYEGASYRGDSRCS